MGTDSVLSTRTFCSQKRSSAFLDRNSHVQMRTLQFRQPLCITEPYATGEMVTCRLRNRARHTLASAVSLSIRPASCLKIFCCFLRLATLMLFCNVCTLAGPQWYLKKPFISITQASCKYCTRRPTTEASFAKIGSAMLKQACSRLFAAAL